METKTQVHAMAKYQFVESIQEHTENFYVRVVENLQKYFHNSFEVREFEFIAFLDVIL